MSGFGNVGQETISPPHGMAGTPLTTQMTYSGLGSVKTYTDQNGRVTNYTTNGLNQINQIQYPALSGSNNVLFTESFAYDGESNLLSHTDRAGITSITGYDNIGRVLNTQTNGLNGTTIPGITSQHIDQKGVDTLGANSYPFDHKRIDTDPLGHVTTYRYDSLNRLTSVTNAEGNTRTLTYDGVNLQSETDFKGQTTSYPVYDPLDRVKQITDRMGKVTSINYDDSNGLTRTITDRNGHNRVEVYDPLGRLSSVNQGGQPLASYQYDNNSNRIGVTDGLGNQTNYTYDPFNRVASIIHGITPQAPNGIQTETFGYDSNGNVTSYSDGVNGVTRVFDELNRLISSTDGEGNTTGFQYDGRGLMTAKIEPNRDAQNNPTSVTQYQYNELGSLTQVTDAAGSVWTYGYDAEQKLISITDPLNAVDPTNRPPTTFGYDTMHRLTSVTRPLGMATTYKYDENSNKTLTIDPLGHHLTTTYDPLDRASTMGITNSDGSSPLGRSGYTFGYDPEGNLTSAIEKVTTGAGYTVPGAVATGPATISRTYGRTYDPRNHLATATDPNGHQITYTYDAANNLRTFTDGGSRQSTYTYDPMNRLSTVTTGSGRLIDYTFQPNGLLSNVNYGNGSQRQYGYDHANRVASITNTFNASSSEEFDYSYDKNSNRTGETRKFNGSVSRTLTYGYDTLNRLTQADYGGGSVVNYGYDAVGNRLTESGTDPSSGAVNKTYTYDGLNRLSTMTDAAHSANSLTFSFDLNGNLSSQKDGSGNTRQYSYDALNQMLTASQSQVAQTVSLRPGTSSQTSAATTAASAAGPATSPSAASLAPAGSTAQLGSYDYDFQGRRLSKTAAGITTSYVYSGINLVNEFGSAGQVVNSYDYGTDLVDAQLGGEGERLYFHDALGSTTALVAGSGSTSGSPGSVVARYEYDAWGKQITAPQPSVNRVNYTTYQHDDETGLEYAQARYYDSSVGRFSSFDPVTEDSQRLAQPQGENYYSYGMAGPLGHTDPNGRDWWMQGQPPTEIKWFPGHHSPGSSWRRVETGVHPLSSGFGNYTEGTPVSVGSDGVMSFPDGGKIYPPDGRYVPPNAQAPEPQPSSGKSGGTGAAKPKTRAQANPKTASTEKDIDQEISESFWSSLELSFIESIPISAALAVLFLMLVVLDAPAALIGTLIGLGLAATIIVLASEIQRLSSDDLSPREKAKGWAGLLGSTIGASGGGIVGGEAGSATVDPALFPKAGSTRPTDTPVNTDTPSSTKSGAPEFSGSESEPGQPKGAQGLSDSSPAVAVKDPFQSLAERRAKLGLPAAGSPDDDATLSILHIDGQEFEGINSGEQNPRTKITLDRVNAQTKTHAEGEAVQKAINAGLQGTAKVAEMWVDRDPCTACGPNSGLRSLARNLGVDKLIVHSPSGTKIYTPTK